MFLSDGPSLPFAFMSIQGREFLEEYPQFRGRRLHIVLSDIRHVIKLREEFPFMSKAEIARRTGVSRPSVRKIIRILESDQNAPNRTKKVVN